MNRVELIMRRRAVLAFIQADPVQIVLMRTPEPTRTAAGGVVRSDPVPLPPQQFRIIPVKRRYDNGLINSEAGSIPHTDYLLLGTYQRDAAVDDVFEYRGNTWHITGLHPTRTESLLCSIDFLGPENG